MVFVIVPHLCCTKKIPLSVGMLVYANIPRCAWWCGGVCRWVSTVVGMYTWVLKKKKHTSYQIAFNRNRCTRVLRVPGVYIKGVVFVIVPHLCCTKEISIFVGMVVYVIYARAGVCVCVCVWVYVCGVWGGVGGYVHMWVCTHGR